MGLSDLITQLPELIGQAVEANQWLGYTAIFAAMFSRICFRSVRADHAPGASMAAGSAGSAACCAGGFAGHGPRCPALVGDRTVDQRERIEAWLQRHGRWIGISADELARSRRWFSRYGTALVFWGRLVPGMHADLGPGGR